ncbi:hypothetical protein B0H10DRAFT_2217166 [Mycena sp. CBHHK59/15]|nr:hypothetical protein B0H10DRAFT_2217166 [Mycena sp. CBHHK59/15]
MSSSWPRFDICCPTQDACTPSPPTPTDAKGSRTQNMSNKDVLRGSQLPSQDLSSPTACTLITSAPITHFIGPEKKNTCICDVPKKPHGSGRVLRTEPGKVPKAAVELVLVDEDALAAAAVTAAAHRLLLGDTADNQLSLASTYRSFPRPRLSLAF